MRMYHGISRFQYRRRFPKGSWDNRTILWGASLKPGDVVASCTGFNVRIATIEPHRVHAHYWLGNGFSRNGWWIQDFRITDSEGDWHTLPGGGCVMPRETVDQIRAYWCGFDENYHESFHNDFTRAVHAAFESGSYPVDADGVLLPEFIELRNRRLADP